jgi:alpha-tubulin suppressor-like RCC1 family protein
MWLLLAALVALVFAGSAQAEGTTAVGWGNNMAAQLDAGYRSAVVLSPVNAQGFEGVVQVQSGDGNTAALLEDGTVRTYGDNTFGELGVPMTEHHQGIQQPPIWGVTQIAVGGQHVLALAHGTVYGWGSAQLGDLGDGRSCMECGVHHPEPILSANVVKVFAGDGSSAALTASGQLYVWGEDRSGQLGVRPNQEGAVVRPTLTSLTNVKDVAFAGVSSHGGAMYVIKGNGELFAAGQNAHGQLGIGTVSRPRSLTHVLNGVSAVAAGAVHALAITNGTAFAWGANCCGQLGPKAPLSQAVTRPTPIGPAQEVSAGYAYSLLVDQGIAYGFGADQEGQLGIGYASKTPISRPMRIGPFTGISAGARSAVAMGAGRKPFIRLIRGPGSLTLVWKSSETTERWKVKCRPKTLPPSGWPAWLILPAATREYTISGLKSGQTYEVWLHNATGGGVVTGTAG